jgi:hypothetical protein
MQPRFSWLLVAKLLVAYHGAMNRTERMIIAAALAAITLLPIAYFILAR